MKYCKHSLSGVCKPCRKKFGIVDPVVALVVDVEIPYNERDIWNQLKEKYSEDRTKAYEAWKTEIFENLDYYLLAYWDNSNNDHEVWAKRGDDTLCFKISILPREKAELK